MTNNLNKKKILLGVTGSIAAYKAPLLVREFVKSGADVTVLMTQSAKEFVSPLTLANLSRNDVIINMFDESSQTSGAWHIELAHSCDIMLIAPCSATTLGKLANAICDSPLISVATALPPEIPLIVSPAMDSTMWLHPATQRSVKLIQSDGALILPPVDGDLSSGFVGPGRFPDIDDVVNFTSYALEYFRNRTRYTVIEDIYKKGHNLPINDDKTTELINKPLETLQDAIEKDKWNAEMDLEKMKKKTNE
ncbi:MAG: hypothetical protein KGZ71_04250 [Desulfobulbaceae bacterium]|nr:hypothetical protein [Candidatus Kapabacteria bacterium]MBS3999674.1 hypothetical protein [Desulfobulbaceae bacterium]